MDFSRHTRIYLWRTSSPPVFPQSPPDQLALPVASHSDDIFLGRLVFRGNIYENTRFTILKTDDRRGEVNVRMIDAIDSSTTRPGDLYDCSIDDPIVSGNQVIVPRGNDCSIQIVEAVANQELALKLFNISIDGTDFDVVTEYAELHSSDTGTTTKGVRRAAGLGALGASIGAIIGGGSGAAIGAATGAGLGALSGATAKGKVLLVPSETRLTFRLREPIPLDSASEFRETASGHAEGSPNTSNGPFIELALGPEVGFALSFGIRETQLAETPSARGRCVLHYGQREDQQLRKPKAQRHNGNNSTLFLQGNSARTILRHWCRHHAQSAQTGCHPRRRATTSLSSGRDKTPPAR